VLRYKPRRVPMAPALVLPFTCVEDLKQLEHQLRELYKVEEHMPCEALLTLPVGELRVHWQNHVETAKQDRTKSKKIVLRMLQMAAAFDHCSKSIKEQKRLRRSAQKVVSRSKRKAASTAFDLWKHNVQSVKQAVRELGQNARFFTAVTVVKFLEGRRNTTLKWRSIRVWQQRALDTKEFQLMCNRMGGLVDARVNKKNLNEWRKVAQSCALMPSTDVQNGCRGGSWRQQWVSGIL
jgi:hypothetical protein